MNITLDLFEYTNTPPELPGREIELNLQFTGHAVVLQDKKNQLFTPITSIYGFDRYYLPTHAVFANPRVLDLRQYEIGKNCEVIYNSSLYNNIMYVESDGGLLSFLCRYARQLADIESTINIYTVNSRLTSIPVTDDQNVTNSIKAFFKKLAFGERAVVTDSNIIENFRNVDVNHSSVYLYQRPGEVMKMGPIWDLDLSMGNYDYIDSQPELFVKSVVGGGGNYLYNNLMRHNEFKSQYGIGDTSFKGLVDGIKKIEFKDLLKALKYFYEIFGVIACLPCKIFNSHRLVKVFKHIYD